MSEGNIELATQVVDALNRRDLARLIDLTDPEVEWRSLFASLGEGGVYSGHEGMRRCMRDIEDAWEMWRVEIDDALAVGQVTLMVGRLHYRGKGSGVETASSAGWVITVSNERVRSARVFREPEEAVKDVGLPQ
jgi:ketosteroid isomerase-like protein